MKTTRILLTKENRPRSLAGTKTMTRRAIMPQPTYFDEYLPADALPGETALSEGVLWKCSQYSKDSDAIKWRRATTPQVGDRLAHLEPYQVDGFVVECRRITGIYLDDRAEFDVILTPDEFSKWNNRKKPLAKTSSRFMYNSLIRYYYEITGIKVERLQDISHNDINNEGLCFASDLGNEYDARSQYILLLEQFSKLWDSINKKRGYGWDINPWVWCYSYRRLE